MTHHPTTQLPISALTVAYRNAHGTTRHAPAILPTDNSNHIRILDAPNTNDHIGDSITLTWTAKRRGAQATGTITEKTETTFTILADTFTTDIQRRSHYRLGVSTPLELHLDETTAAAITYNLSGSGAHIFMADCENIPLTVGHTTPGTLHIPGHRIDIQAHVIDVSRNDVAARLSFANLTEPVADLVAAYLAAEQRRIAARKSGLE